MGKFPIKKQGDDLGAEHVNWLTAGVEKLLSREEGGGGVSHSSPPSSSRGYSVNGSNFPPFSLQQFEIVEVGCDGNENLYRMVPRYWDNTSGEWKTDNSTGNRGYSLDATDSDQTYSVEDKVQAYYDVQRGTYLPLAAGGSGAPRIRFTILSADFTVGFGALGCDHVVVIVNHVSCGGTGVAVGDEVRVYDPEYCHFNLPLELLIGLSGTATWMKSENYLVGLDYFDYCIAELRAAGCMWMIDTLCCAEEENLNG